MDFRNIDFYDVKRSHLHAVAQSRTARRSHAWRTVRALAVYLGIVAFCLGFWAVIALAVRAFAR